MLNAGGPGAGEAGPLWAVVRSPPPPLPPLFGVWVGRGRVFSSSKRRRKKLTFHPSFTPASSSCSTNTKHKRTQKIRQKLAAPLSGTSPRTAAPATPTSPPRPRGSASRRRYCSRRRASRRSLAGGARSSTRATRATGAEFCFSLFFSLNAGERSKGGVVAGCFGDSFFFFFSFQTIIEHFRPSTITKKMPFSNPFFLSDLSAISRLYDHSPE